MTALVQRVSAADKITSTSAEHQATTRIQIWDYFIYLLGYYFKYWQEYVARVIEIMSGVILVEFPLVWSWWSHALISITGHF